MAAAAESVRPLDWVVEAPDCESMRSAWTDERRSSVWVTGMVVRSARAWAKSRVMRACTPIRPDIR